MCNGWWTDCVTCIDEVEWSCDMYWSGGLVM